MAAERALEDAKPMVFGETSHRGIDRLPSLAIPSDGPGASNSSKDQTRVR